MEFEGDITLKPIGVVHVDYPDDAVRRSLKGVSGKIEVFPKYEPGLKGINEYSHIILIAYLHKVPESSRDTLQVHFRKFERMGVRVDDLPVVGVFTTDSPHRPNPIALTIVRLIKQVGRTLYVDGLDLFDGTPIIDIKGYDMKRSLKEFRVPWWLKKLAERTREKFGVETI